MEIEDHILDAFIKTSSGGFVVARTPQRAEAIAETRRRYRAAFAALPLLAVLPDDVVAAARKYNDLPAPEQLAAGNMAHLNLASFVGERVIGLLGDVQTAPASPPKPIDDEAVDVNEEDLELAAELAAEAIMELIDREFWRTIQAGLTTRLAALDD